MHMVKACQIACSKIVLRSLYMVKFLKIVFWTISIVISYGFNFCLRKAIVYMDCYMSIPLH